MKYETIQAIEDVADIHEAIDLDSDGAEAEVWKREIDGIVDYADMSNPAVQAILYLSVAAVAIRLFEALPIEVQGEAVIKADKEAAEAWAKAPYPRVL